MSEQRNTPNGALRRVSARILVRVCAHLELLAWKQHVRDRTFRLLTMARCRGVPLLETRGSQAAQLYLVIVLLVHGGQMAYRWPSLGVSRWSFHTTGLRRREAGTPRTSITLCRGRTGVLFEAQATMKIACIVQLLQFCGEQRFWDVHQVVVDLLIGEPTAGGAPSRLKYIWLTHGLTIGVSQIALIISRLPYAGMFQARIRPPQNPPCLQPRRRQAIQPRFQHEAPRARHRAFQPLPPLERQVECPQMFQPRVPPCKK